MNEINPYAAPMVDGKRDLPVGGSGVWRDGKRLVVQHGATLPPFCVRTNQPSQKLLNRKFYWHHPAVYFAILLNILIYVILAVVLRKKHQFDIPLSEDAMGTRRKWMGIAWAIALACVAGFIGAIFGLVSPDGQYSGFFLAILLGSIFGILLALVIGSRAAGVLVPKRMTATTSWYSGADPDYLNRLPQLPPQHL